MTRRRARFLPALVALLLVQSFGLPPPVARGAAEATERNDDPNPSRASFLSRHRKALLIGTAAGSAAGGVAAVLLRRAANDRFAAYQRTADPERLAALYDEAERLDNSAAACFIASEAMLVMALYLGFFVDPAQEMAATSPSGSAPRLNWVAERGLALRWSF